MGVGSLEAETLGQRLRKLRMDKGISVEEVGRLLNIGFSSIAKYERDEQLPPADKLKMLGDFYGVSVDYILGHEPWPAPQDLSAEVRTILRYAEQLTPEQAARVRQMMEILFPEVFKQ